MTPVAVILALTLALTQVSALSNIRYRHDYRRQSQEQPILCSSKRSVGLLPLATTTCDYETCTYQGTSGFCCLDNNTFQCKCLLDYGCNRPPSARNVELFCPELEKRILNGQKVSTDCTYPGYAKIIRDNNTQVCNAAFTFAQINDISVFAFLTTYYCSKVIANGISKFGVTYSVVLGDATLKIEAPYITLHDGANGTSFIAIDLNNAGPNVDIGPCERPACPFNRKTMAGKVDFNSCKVLSSGASNGNLEMNGLYEADVKLTPGGCVDIPDKYLATDTLCFKAVSGQNLFNTGDVGAPVYCMAASTQEWLLVGVVAYQNRVDHTPEVTVITYPH